MTRRIAVAAVTVIALVFVIGHSSDAQGLKQELLKGLAKSLGPDAVQAMMIQVASEVSKNPELRRQLIDALGPEATRAIVTSAMGHTAEARPMPAAVDASRGPVKGVNAQVAVRNSSTSAHAKPQASLPKQTERAEPTGSKKVNLGPLAIVVNPSNPINELTVDQVRKLASGEYTNWSQVGGPDRPVKVVTVRGGRGPAESLLNTTLAPTTTALAFNSFVIPAVDQNDGAIGLIPTSTLEQVDFIGTHDAVKVIGVKRDNHQSPAVAPSRMAVYTGSYPMM